MMKASKLGVLIGAAAIAACGGDNQVAGIDGRGANPPPPPVAVSVVSVGTITGFGSVIVNGIRYETGSAAVTVDGNVGAESDLAVGQVVIVRGTLNSDGTTGVASQIDYDDIVEGPIESIDIAAGTLTVLSQLIRVDDGTSFGLAITPASLDGLQVGDPIEVSGFLLADASISATRIERSDDNDLEIVGRVANLSGTTFMINDLLVDFSAATLEDFPNGAPEDGQLVEAEGNVLGGAGELIATRVEFEDDLFSDDSPDLVEIEGFITRFSSATDFDVEGVPVTTNGQTQYEGGVEADLGINRKVEVEGEFDANGVLVASEIELKAAGFIRIEGLVDDIQGDLLTVLGLNVRIEPGTRIEDKSSAEVEPFDAADINVGDYLEIRAFENANGLIATRVERDDFDQEVALRGFVDSVAAPNFTILGVPVETSAGTDFEDRNDQPITADAFFDQALDSLVEASGAWVNGVIVAEEVELED